MPTSYIVEVDLSPTTLNAIERPLATGSSEEKAGYNLRSNDYAKDHLDCHTQGREGRGFRTPQLCAVGGPQGHCRACPFALRGFPPFASLRWRCLGDLIGFDLSFRTAKRNVHGFPTFVDRVYNRVIMMDFHTRRICALGEVHLRGQSLCGGKDLK